MRMAKENWNEQVKELNVVRTLSMRMPGPSVASAATGVRLVPVSEALARAVTLLPNCCFGIARNARRLTAF